MRGENGSIDCFYYCETGKRMGGVWVHDNTRKGHPHAMYLCIEVGVSLLYSPTKLKPESMFPVSGFLLCGFRFCFLGYVGVVWVR